VSEIDTGSVLDSEADWWDSDSDSVSDPVGVRATVVAVRDVVKDDVNLDRDADCILDRLRGVLGDWLAAVAEGTSDRVRVAVIVGVVGTDAVDSLAEGEPVSVSGCVTVMESVNEA
jgi:hypothetical protein